jgi:hypothetical protein
MDYECGDKLRRALLQVVPAYGLFMAVWATLFLE